ncbi:hypothetical protein CYMTET_17879 [Cymbomonas tetramitiformis]|uniref:glutamate--tRNA ligase n=1 Tax=Cymbomonas tetramitiformis TaxID=36881 RepID=A0AAE0G974_9CHLO|nr:hypothetical protein CYMTET_17879 [Cymbomonas tetramitiformis]
MVGQHSNILIPRRRTGDHSKREKPTYLWDLRSKEQRMAATLRFGQAAPLAVLSAAQICEVPLEVSSDKALPRDSPAVLELASGELSGTSTLLRYLARAGTTPFGFYGPDALEATQVDQWLDFLPSLAAGGGLSAACTYLDDYLRLRTFFVGNLFSLADVGVWGAVAGNMQFASLTKGNKLPHLLRWFHFISAHPVLKGIAEQHTRKPPASKSAEQSTGGKKTGGSFEVELKDAKMGEVVTRFPPEPSGYLHIGHAKAALLNDYFAKAYKGKLIVRFDDTNPSKEKDEFEQSIIEDLKTLGITADQVTHTSDWFDDLQKMGRKLIDEGKMYVDDTPVDQMRKERMDGIVSARRDASIENNVELWQEMLKGSERGLECAARFKMDMKHNNKALRDPVAFRCNLTPHHQTGTKYKCYPTYDCACPFVDAVEGVTHALRTSEYADRDAQFKWVQELMGVRKVHIWEYSRMNFVNTVLSKRKLQWFVDQGFVEGWNDPRFPTVQGIIRRGMQVEALREFILSQGASKNLNFMEWDKIWTINKKLIDPVCARHTAVLAATKVPLVLSNGPEPPTVVIIPRHKKYPDAGKKATTMTKTLWLDAADAEVVSEGEEVTLMDWGNCFIRGIERNSAGTVTALTGELHLEGLVKNTKLKTTWLPQIEDLVEMTLVDLGHLVTKKKLEEDDDIADLVNQDSKVSIAALGDANCRNIKQGEVIQLERRGYYRCDSVYMGPGRPMVLFNIPDGREKK